MRAPLASVSFVATLLLSSGPLRAGSETEMRHGNWRDCLSHNFQIQSTLTDPDLAADSAFRACRGAEEAYLAALTASPLLDEDDVTRARPRLTGRIRAWLVGNRE